MPNKDGTGPWWAKDGCGTGSQRSFSLETKTMYKLLTAAIPIVAGIVKDLTNPNGFLRGVTRKLLAKGNLIEGKTAVQAKFKVVDESKEQGMKSV